MRECLFLLGRDWVFVLATQTISFLSSLTDVSKSQKEKEKKAPLFKKTASASFSEPWNVINTHRGKVRGTR